MHLRKARMKNPDPASALTRRFDRFAAILCFLVAAATLVNAALGAIDVARSCPGSRHGCGYLGLGTAIFFAIALVATALGRWLWPSAPRVSS